MNHKEFSVWDQVPLGAPDVIFGVNEAYGRDEFPEKINISVGAFRDDSGSPFVLECVKQAEARIASLYPNHEYSSPDGLEAFNLESVKLAYYPSLSPSGELSIEDVICFLIF